MFALCALSTLWRSCGAAKLLICADLGSVSGNCTAWTSVILPPDGSYVAHVITSNGEYHVTVSRDFKVTGAQQGGPGQGGVDDGAPSDDST